MPREGQPEAMGLCRLGGDGEKAAVRKSLESWKESVPEGRAWGGPVQWGCPQRGCIIVHQQ